MLINFSSLLFATNDDFSQFNSLTFRVCFNELAKNLSLVYFLSQNQIDLYFHLCLFGSSLAEFVFVNESTNRVQSDEDNEDNNNNNATTTTTTLQMLNPISHTISVELAKEIYNLLD